MKDCISIGKIEFVGSRISIKGWQDYRGIGVTVNEKFIGIIDCSGEVNLKGLPWDDRKPHVIELWKEEHGKIG